MSPSPPKAAERLLAWLTNPLDRPFVLADAAERFGSIARSEGPRAARRWYWSQALRAGPAAFHARVLDVRELGLRGAAEEARRVARTVAKRPLYATGVVGTLAMGLASAAIVVTVAWSVWLAPLPIPNPEGVVRLLELDLAETDHLESQSPAWRLAPPLLEDARRADFSTIRAVSGVAQHLFDWEVDGELGRLSARVVSPEAFAILGIEPRHGRTIESDVMPEVVLTTPFWLREFGGDPDVVGSVALTLNGEDHRVVGVADLPEGYPGHADVVTVFRFTPDELTEGMRGARYLDVIARVEPGRSIAEASAEFDAFVRGQGSIHPQHRGWGGRAESLHASLFAPYTSVLKLLLGAGILFLALASANATGLVAARALDSARDHAVRLALGASRRRLLRAMIVECLALTLLSAAIALWLAYGLLGPVRSMMPADAPRVGEVALSPVLIGGVLMGATAIGLLVALLAHALSSKASVTGLRARSRGFTGTRGRGVIVVGQVALTTLLVTTGAVVLSRMAELRSVDLGFEPEDLVSSQVILGSDRYPTPESRLLFWDGILERASARGLEVAIGTNAPMSGMNFPFGYRINPGDDQSFAQYHIVSPGYLGLMEIDLIAGRDFSTDDVAEGEKVIIVNERFVEEHFPQGEAVGQEITVLADRARIVGVAASVRHAGPSEEAPTEIYAPFTQAPWPHAHVVARGTPQLLAGPISELLDDVDPSLNAPAAEGYSRYVSGWFAAIRIQAIIVTILAGVGTALAAFGLYALVAYRVRARRREIGIRMALGASGSRTFSSVVRHGAGLGAVGMAFGFGVWLVLGARVSELLGEVAAADIRIALLVTLLVGIVVVTASAVPAMRSVTVDPSVTLRDDES